MIKDLLNQFDNYEGDYNSLDNIPKDYKENIGYLIIIFSSVEHSINLVISDLISDRSHEPGYQVVSNLRMNPKISLLETLLNSLMVHSNLTHRKDELTKIIDRLNKLNEFRNKVAHANWTSLKHDGMVRTRIKTNNKLGAVEFINFQITPKILSEQISEADLLITAVGDYFMSISNESLGHGPEVLTV